MIEPKITSIFDELVENSSIEVGHSMTAITLGFFYRLVLIEYVEFLAALDLYRKHSFQTL